ncbi:FxLYD domain-containing protein [Streptomyces sp. NPDC127084]|uniref:FxLYD domain-containing protein n=1 Tax=Streptomyces sp. NPDC127084 TaxID=3347133 RepID=UPI00366A2CAC
MRSSRGTRDPHDTRGPRNALIRNALIAAALIAGVLTGCSSDNGETPASAASKASDLIASATAKLSDIQGGFDVTGDVKAGSTANENGRAVAEITATNNSSSTADFTVQVNFKDSDGNLLDAVVVNIDGVPAGGTKSADARSNRDLSGTPPAEIARAVRH